MKFAGILAAVLVFPMSGVRAQSLSGSPYLLMPPTPALFAPFATVAGSPGLYPALTPSLRPSAALSALPTPVPAPVPQGPAGVFAPLYWQAYIGYSYFRFYEVPHSIINTSGFEGSMAYYFKDWLGAEGEMDGGFGSQAGETAKFVFGGGGLRGRSLALKPVELWAHGVIGGAHFLPKVTYGGPGAFGYELGGGLDFDMRRRFSFRAEADIIGTTFFSTYQISPKISAGIVYNF